MPCSTNCRAQAAGELHDVVAVSSGMGRSLVDDPAGAGGPGAVAGRAASAGYPGDARRHRSAVGDGHCEERRDHDHSLSAAVEGRAEGRHHRLQERRLRRGSQAGSRRLSAAGPHRSAGRDLHSRRRLCPRRQGCVWRDVRQRRHLVCAPGHAWHQCDLPSRAGREVAGRCGRCSRHGELGQGERGEIRRRSKPRLPHRALRRCHARCLIYF